MVDCRADEAALHIRVDLAGRLPGLCSLANGPCPGFRFTGGEKCEQPEKIVRGPDETNQAGFSHSELPEVFRAFLKVEARDLRLDATGQLHPFRRTVLCQCLDTVDGWIVFLPFANVHSKDDGFGGQHLILAQPCLLIPRERS